MPSTVSMFLASRGPQRLGLCPSDVPRNCSYINAAIQELLNKAPEDGWKDGWDQLRFNVPVGSPYVTLPYRYSRAITINICRAAIQTQTIWYETLYAGVGLKSACQGPNGCCGALQAYARPTVATAFDLTPTNQKLRIYITDTRDAGKKIVFTDAKDSNGNGIYSQGGQYNVIGFYLYFTQPFVTSDFIVTSFSNVFKDETYGDVVLMQVDATTGVESLLARYGPKDTAPSYRRYLISGMPDGCCEQGVPVQPAQATIMAKVGFQPVSAPTDVLAVSNIPALVEFCSSIRHREMDNVASKAMAIREEADAIRLLNQELMTENGQAPAINISVFGSATLARAKIGYVW